jgi:ribonucleoside-diphosphate reductase alpha chain
MLQDMLMTYKLGWKTSYYQNTYDYKEDPSEAEEKKEQETVQIDNLNKDEEACEACAI